MSDKLKDMSIEMQEDLFLDMLNMYNEKDLSGTEFFLWVEAQYSDPSNERVKAIKELKDLNLKLIKSACPMIEHDPSWGTNKCIKHDIEWTDENDPVYLNKRIEQLESKIEKMKNCQNCQHMTFDLFSSSCKQGCNYIKGTLNLAYNNWKLKEAH